MLPNMLYAKVLRSPYAHARILSIDTSRGGAAAGRQGRHHRHRRAPHLHLRHRRARRALPLLGRRGPLRGPGGGRRGRPGPGRGRGSGGAHRGGVGAAAGRPHHRGGARARSPAGAPGARRTWRATWPSTCSSTGATWTRASPQADVVVEEDYVTGHGQPGVHGARGGRGQLRRRRAAHRAGSRAPGPPTCATSWPWSCSCR